MDSMTHTFDDFDETTIDDDLDLSTCHETHRSTHSLRPAIRPGMGCVYRTAIDASDGGATVTDTDSADVTSTGGPREDEDLPPSVRCRLN